MGLGMTDESSVVVDDHDFPKLPTVERNVLRGLISIRAKLLRMWGIEESTSATSKRGYCECWHGSTIEADRRFPQAVVAAAT